MGHSLEEFLKRNCIEHKYIAVYHPGGNGEVERFNRVLKDAIKLANFRGQDWL